MHKPISWVVTKEIEGGFFSGNGAARSDVFIVRFQPLDTTLLVPSRINASLLTMNQYQKPSIVIPSVSRDVPINVPMVELKIEKCSPVCASTNSTFQFADAMIKSLLHNKNIDILQLVPTMYLEPIRKVLLLDE